MEDDIDLLDTLNDLDHTTNSETSDNYCLDASVAKVSPVEKDDDLTGGHNEQVKQVPAVGKEI